MEIWQAIGSFLSATNPIYIWLTFFLLTGFLVAVFRGFFLARKIQPKGFRWKQIRHELLFGIINIATAGFALGFITTTLTENGYITFNSEPVSWWVIALEYAFYFLAFDTYFYWFHRLMHQEPIYTWVHKIHHYSMSPNPLTTLSVSPFESVINGGFLPLFTAAFMVHEPTMALIAPTNIFMGLYVHSGFEFFPRWWNKSWATKWFITATFHDQHHRYFKGNYGGYTTIWDRLCGTMRPSFEQDFDAVKARAAQRVPAQVALESAGADD